MDFSTLVHPSDDRSWFGAARRVTVIIKSSIWQRIVYRVCSEWESHPVMLLRNARFDHDLLNADAPFGAIDSSMTNSVHGYLRICIQIHD